jgi:glyoxylase-like metal-dependent hydrolase (beta-lactamase superfamily II)
MTTGATNGTRVFGPTVAVDDGDIIELDGARFRIHHSGHGHTDHDIMIEVIGEHSMFLGDVVTNKRVPSSDVPQDANYKGQIQAIRAILQQAVTHYIPGHGLSGGRELPEASLAFLEKLYTSVSKHYQQGLSADEMKDKVIAELAEYKDWHNFNEMGRVITYVYLEVEQELF